MFRDPLRGNPLLLAVECLAFVLVIAAAWLMPAPVRRHRRPCGASRSPLEPEEAAARGTLALSHGAAPPFATRRGATLSPTNSTHAPIATVLTPPAQTGGTVRAGAGASLLRPWPATAMRAEGQLRPRGGAGEPPDQSPGRGGGGRARESRIRVRRRRGTPMLCATAADPARGWLAGDPVPDAGSRLDNLGLAKFASEPWALTERHCDSDGGGAARYQVAKR